MIPPDQGIVQPVRSKRTPELGPVAIMAATEADFQDLRRQLDLPERRKLFLSQLCYGTNDHGKPSLVGPVMGAPYAAMLQETLYAWGMQNLIFFGWCGSISSRYRSGDIIVPDGAIIDEGTSLHYRQGTGAEVQPNAEQRSALEKALDDQSIEHRNGRIWTTDGIFRETPDRVQRFRAEGAVGVDMELSALISVAMFHNLPIAAVLAVSDELFDLQWRPGFSKAEFRASRGKICDLLSQIDGNMFHERD